MSRGPWHALGIGLVGLVFLGVATLLDGWLPDDTDDPGAEPFLRRAAVGEQVDLRTATVRVDTVTGSSTLVEYGAEMSSPGLWVVVEYTVVPTRENTAVGMVELRDDSGRVWSTTGRGSNSCAAGPPGARVGCVAFVEVPRDAVPGLRIRLARDAVELRYDVVAEVDLALTAADADAWASASVLEVPETWLGERP